MSDKYCANWPTEHEASVAEAEPDGLSMVRIAAASLEPFESRPYLALTPAK